jgi:hypothetical protein
MIGPGNKNTQAWVFDAKTKSTNLVALTETDLKR